VILAPNGGAIAIKSDCNSAHAYLDAYAGGASAVAECARNLVCVGAKPIALVDNLSFGNPQKPEVMWTFAEAIRGIADGCIAFDSPCVGGNVSFYNEDDETHVAIKPAPVIVMLGLIEDRKRIRGMAFRDGETIILIGETKSEMGGSEYYRVIHDEENGEVPKVDWKEEKKNADFVYNANELISASHDCSKGGLAIALAEMCIEAGIGAEIDLSKVASPTKRTDEKLFSETNARYIISTRDPDAVLKLARKKGATATIIGRTGRDRLKIAGFELKVSEMRNVWEQEMFKVMGGRL
jgi:phosphoribosylformylglycinamidine (FGAM) synthase-like enzyme